MRSAPLGHVAALKRTLAFIPRALGSHYGLLSRGAGLPWWFSSKECICNAGAARDVGSIPGSRRSPGGGHGNLLQYPCLENSRDRGAWRATGHRAAESQTRLSPHTHTHSPCWSSGSNSPLPREGARMPSLVRELDRTCCK